MPWTEMRDAANPPVPKELIIGVTESEWPLQVFEQDAHALVWIQGAEQSRRRRLFRVSVEVLEELELVPPAAPSLRPKGNPS